MSLSLPSCVAIAPTGEPEAPGLGARAAGEPLPGSGFQVWDMHANGTEPGRSVKVIDGSLAARGYWLSSSFLGMPRSEAGARIGAGVVLAEANLADRERVLRERIAGSGIAGTSAMVMLDAEAFEPFDGEVALGWYDQTARVATESFGRWFWYFQPGRVESAVPGRFESEEAYFDWYASQEFVRLATAVGVTVYHGREQDAGSPGSAASRTRNDRHLTRAIGFAKRVGKPLIVVVRADLSGRPREQIMTREALEASWRELFEREGVDGIAIWNDQPEASIEFDRRWARTRIEPVLRTLVDERQRGRD